MSNFRTYNERDNLPVHTAWVDAISLGSTLVIAAKPDMSFRIVSVAVISSATNSVKFLSGITQISPAYPLGINGGFIMNHNQYGWFRTALGEALNVNLSSGVAVGVSVTYVEDNYV